MLDGCFLESTTGLIKLPETSVATFQDFYIWALSRLPRIDSEAPFEAVVDLAIFATMYDVISLQNQAVDVIRNKLYRAEWQLQPAVVERIYENVGEESTLRRLIRVSLGTIKELKTLGYSQKTSPEATEDFIHGWREIFIKIADIGADYFETTKRGWAGNELNIGGPCRFHDHRGRPVPNSSTETSAECPFVIMECFGSELDAVPQEVAMVKSSKKKKNKGKMPASMGTLDWDDFGQQAGPGVIIENKAIE
jgi:hypothetical protein